MQHLVYIIEFADLNNFSIHALFPIHVKMNLKDHSKEKYIVTQFLASNPILYRMNLYMTLLVTLAGVMGPWRGCHCKSIVT